MYLLIAHSFNMLFSFIPSSLGISLIRTLIENRDKVVLAPASSAYKHSLKEVLSSPGISARIKNTKAAKEVEALQVCDVPRFCAFKTPT